MQPKHLGREFHTAEAFGKGVPCSRSIWEGSSMQPEHLGRDFHAAEALQRCSSAEFPGSGSRHGMYTPFRDQKGLISLEHTGRNYEETRNACHPSPEGLFVMS